MRELGLKRGLMRGERRFGVGRRIVWRIGGFDRAGEVECYRSEDLGGLFRGFDRVEEI